MPRTTKVIHALVGSAMAAGLLFGLVGQAAAANSVLSKGVCDAATGTIYAAPPTITAGTGSVTARYWVRFVDSDSEAPLTDWVYGGQATSVGSAPAPFTSASIHGSPYWVYWHGLAGGRHVRAQYAEAVLRPDGSWLATPWQVLKLYKLWTATYQYGYGGLSAGWGRDQTYC